jgi:hypothetical protein
MLIAQFKNVIFKKCPPPIYTKLQQQSQLGEQVSLQAPPEGQQTVRLSQMKRKVIPQRGSSIGEGFEARALVSTL